MQHNNLLLDKPPQTVNIEGTEYSVNADFRTLILFELCLRGDYSSSEQIETGCKLFYGDFLPPDVNAAFDRLIWFYRCGEEEQPGTGEGPYYCFEQDHDLIYAAFLERYSIDLSDDNSYLHWWRFRALFNGLHDTRFTDIMQIRGYKGKDSKALALKRLYVLRPKAGKKETAALKKFNDIFYAG